MSEHVERVVERRVSDVLPSLYFSPAAEVLVTECGHRHVRPVGYYAKGSFMRCPFCEDDNPPPPWTEPEP